MFEKWKRKNEPLPQIDIITKWDKRDEDFYASGALIRVTGGKNLLVENFSEEPGEKTYVTLMFDGKPLLQLQGEEYFCPTCEKIVRSGYQLGKGEFHIEKLNEGEVSFADAFNEIVPILGLLRDNYYVILDTELYPTDGNGHLFWNVPDSNQPMPGSCLYYRGDGEWGLLRPYFTIATQSIKNLNTSRVDYYREHAGCRVLAYYMDGYMTALIDGHHKAMAAALEHKKVNAFVVMPCYLQRFGQGNGKFRSYIAAGDMRFACDEYGIDDIPKVMVEKISEAEMENINRMISVPEEKFPYDSDALASYYPSVDEISCIDAAGEISDERLDRIVSEQDVCQIDEIITLIKAMGGLQHKRLFEIGDFFLQRCSYTFLPRYHNSGMAEAILDELMKLPRDTELENYLIDFMVECESDFPAVGEKILEYL